MRADLPVVNVLPPAWLPGGRSARACDNRRKPSRGTEPLVRSPGLRMRRPVPGSVSPTRRDERGRDRAEPLGPVGPGRGGRARPERDRGASAASPTPGGPVAAGAAGPWMTQETTMMTTVTEIREIDRDEMAGVDGGQLAPGYTLPPPASMISMASWYQTQTTSNTNISGYERGRRGRRRDRRPAPAPL
jgi:hypothetical protein